MGRKQGKSKLRSSLEFSIAEALRAVKLSCDQSYRAVLKREEGEELYQGQTPEQHLAATRFIALQEWSHLLDRFDAIPQSYLLARHRNVMKETVARATELRSLSVQVPKDDGITEWSSTIARSVTRWIERVHLVLSAGRQRKGPEPVLTRKSSSSSESEES